MIEHTEENDGDFAHFVKNPDDTITYACQFYNGGTCLSEVVENEINKLNK